MDEYLGPNYPYHQNISIPEDMGMSPKGDMDALATNITGLINYGSLIMTGDTIANKKIKNEQNNLGGQQPLGDRIFVGTPGDCYMTNTDGKYVDEKFTVLADQEKPPETTVDRHVLIDHIPTGNIPGLGNLSSMKGFIPGVMDNIFNLNPIKMIKAMEQPAVPKCLHLQYETIKFNDEKSDSEKHEVIVEDKWISTEDLKDLNPCTFKSAKDGSGYPKINGVSVSQTLTDNNFTHPLKENVTASCNWIESPESFANLFKMKNKPVRKSIINVKNKPIAKLFNLSFGLLLTYLLYKVLRKEINVIN